jgi:beta-lactamase class A
VIDDFTRAGCQGWLHAREVSGAGEVELGADEPVVAASVIKVLVVLDFFRRAEAGEIDPAEQITLRADSRTPGPTGISTFADDVTASLRDLARLALVISDNAATDVLMNSLGLRSIQATATGLGLTGTRVTVTKQQLVDSIALDAGYANWRSVEQAAEDPEVEAELRPRLAAAGALRPESTNTTTARDMTTLLSLIWRDEAGPPAACAQVRSLMAGQLQRERLATGFPQGVRVAAKSGGLMGVIRNEIGVISYPGGDHYAVAVFTRANQPHIGEREINAAIGTEAANAVGLLRLGEDRL